MQDFRSNLILVHPRKSAAKSFFRDEAANSSRDHFPPYRGAHHRLVATMWGFGFPTTRIVLDGGLSVGALMSIRFPLAGLVMFAILRAKGIRINRRGVLDGIWLGLVLVVVFWLQTDGMRFTATAKAGFITGLYVLFTPLVALVIGQRVKLASALGAVIAAYGLYLLVHLPGSWWGAGTGVTLRSCCAPCCAVCTS